jgi:hypothetical protein
MNRYFAVALAFALLAVGGVVLYGLGSVTEPAARGAFGVGFLGACAAVAVGLYRATTRTDHPE